jgi:fucose permease
MRPRRVRFTIRGLMIAVLVVAVLLSMAIRDLIFLILCTTVLAIMFCCAYRLAITTIGWRGHSHVAAMMGRSVAPTLPSRIDRFVRQR